MSMSDEIKEEIVSHYSYDHGVTSSKSDWKRLSKKKVGDLWVRHFENKTAKVRVYAVTDEDDDSLCLIHDGKWLFAFAENEKRGSFSFCDEDSWKRQPYIADWHLGYALTAVFGMPDYEEVYENNFISNKTQAEIKAELEALGFAHSPEMEKTLKN